jgi:Putative beta-barrel porin-2, OmpL-like. bbp2
MIKHLSKISGVAAFAVIASSASAEVKINENLSLDGYAIGAFAVTEGSPVQNDTFLDSGNKLIDAAKIALNGKYGDFSGKISLLAIPQAGNGTSNADAGILDAYVTYTTGDFAITGGKFNSWLGYESFDSPNNAFITYGAADNVGYVANYATGVKFEYLTETLSAGVSARDSILADDNVPVGNSFYQGDGEISDDVGFEAYVLYSGIEKLTVFLGYGFENTDGAVDDTFTYNAWAAYAASDKLTLVASYASKFNGTAAGTVTASYTLQASYAVNEALSVAARYGQADGKTGSINGGSNYTDYGVASTYTITENFAVKGEVTKQDYNDGVGDTFFYAVQGLFKF